MDKSNDKIKNYNSLTQKELIKTISDLNKACNNLQKEVNKYKYYAFCDVMTTNKINKISQQNIIIFNRTYWDMIYRKEHANDECDFYLIDLNDLKLINDTKGHYHGDKHICNCVKILSYFGKVFRLGGDEFIVIAHKEKENEFKEYLTKQGYNLDFAYGYKHKTSNDTFSQVLKYTDNEMYKFKNKQKLLNNK